MPTYPFDQYQIARQFAHVFPNGGNLTLYGNGKNREEAQADLDRQIASLRRSLAEPGRKPSRDGS